MATETRYYGLCSHLTSVGSMNFTVNCFVWSYFPSNIPYSPYKTRVPSNMLLAVWAETLDKAFSKFWQIQSNYK